MSLTATTDRFGRVSRQVTVVGARSAINGQLISGETPQYFALPDGGAFSLNYDTTVQARLADSFAWIQDSLDDTAEYFEKLGETIRASMAPMAEKLRSFAYRTGTFRIDASGFPVVAESCVDGVTLTALPQGSPAPLAQDWWRTFLEDARNLPTDVSEMADISIGTMSGLDVGAVAHGTLADIFAGVDEKLAQYSEIVFPTVVFIPRSKSCDSRSRQTRRYQESLPRFHSKISPLISNRSLHHPSWDRSLQVRA
ncbi:MAG: hypothetical protein FD180_3185 [Planctomycetota bacterium]|nr:MAG: hypothetical protein FD180_3185 [Planctomycetota bacterium]